MSTAGCVLFLIDESAAMGSEFPDDALTGPTSAPPGPPPVPGKTTAPVSLAANSKASRLATVVNAWMKRTAERSGADVALIGYRTNADGVAEVSSRWGGALQDRQWVSLLEAARLPVRTETRTRRLPPTAPGGSAEQTVEFPIWLEPRAAGKAAQLTGWQRCQELLTEWAARGNSGRRPVVVHLFASTSADGNPQRVIDLLRRHATNPLVMQIHLRSGRSATPSLFPSNVIFLPAGAQKDLFQRSSPLPDEWKSALLKRKQSVQPNAVAMIYNARLPDVAAALNLVEAHVDGATSIDTSTIMEEKQPDVIPETVVTVPETLVTPTQVAVDEQTPIPQPADETTPPMEPETPESTPGLAADRRGPRAAVFLLDRSVADPYGSALNSPFNKLQERMNRALASLSRKPTGQLHLGMVTYGGDDSGLADVRTEAWSGEHSGREWITDADLATAAIRVEESEEERPNGIGGLIVIPIRKPVYLETESASQGPLSAVAQHVSRFIDEWRRQHGDAVRDVVVVHYSRAGWSADDLRAATTDWKSTTSSSDLPALPVTLYHVLIPDTPHPAVTYPATSDGLSLPVLEAAFESSDGLLGAATGDVERPGIVVADSRGMTVNADFDVLTDSLRSALQ